MTNNEKKIKVLEEDLTISNNLNYLLSKTLDQERQAMKKLVDENARLIAELDKALRKLDNDY